MTLLSTAQHLARDTRRNPRAHLLPIIISAVIAAVAIALVAYLLWPTYATVPPSDPSRLPVSVGGTLFNVPTLAVRMKIQRHSGPQERVDLSFLYPSLKAPAAPKHYSADTIEDKVQPIDRIFVSIAAHHDSLAPDMRLRTIYPRYLENAATTNDGLTTRAFRDGSAYGGEDLVTASEPELTARCSRDLNARHVPERAAHRGRRPDVPLSAQLACAMARYRNRNGSPLRADAQREGIARRHCRIGGVDRARRPHHSRRSSR